MEAIKNYDLIIVGGGMVGATLAAALANTSLKIAVLDQAAPLPFSPDQPHDLRVSALSVASQNILEHIGAWEGIMERRSCPYRRMRVWEEAGRGDTLFDCADINQSHLGHIVENRIVQLAIWDKLQHQNNIELIPNTSISSINYHPSQSSMILVDGRVLKTSLLVGADGGQSQVREAAGIGVQSWDYAQHALVAYVETNYVQQDITWQKFVPSGPLAFLPLTGNYGSIVWYNKPGEVQRLKALDEQEFMAELYSTFPKELGDLNRLIQRASFPLKRQHAIEYCKQGIVLAGDAAHMIHPLAGQGVNIGLLDAAVLAETLIDADARGDNVFELAVLQKYERHRRQHNLTMMTVMDLFYRAFSNDNIPLKLLRNLGLNVAQNLSPVKNKAMRFAMGLEGDLPSMAK